MKRIVALLFIFLFNTTNLFGETMKKTIMIDLDGVLDNYNGNYIEDTIPDIKSGAKEFIEKLSKDYELILFTTRNSKLATIWLQDNKIDKYFKDVTNVKIPAYIYIDDRAIKFEGDYNKTLDEIKKHNVYWKQ